MAVYTGDMNKDDFWAKTGKTQSKMGFAAEGVINDNLSGNAMDAYGVRSREALARSEANSRANTAAQIQRAGFAGTPIGAGAANAYEAAMLQNRFANNLDIEVQRQDMRRQGVNMAMDYANNANRFGFEQAQEGRAADLHGQTMRDYSLENLSESIMARPDIMNAVNSAYSNPMATPQQKQAAMDAVRNDPILSMDIQAAWVRSGQQGAYTDEFAYTQMNHINSTTNPRKLIENAVNQYFPDSIDADGNPVDNSDIRKAIVDGSIVQMLKSEGFTMMEDGTFELEEDVEKKTYNSDRDNPWTSENAKSILENGRAENPQEYKTVIDDMASSIKKGEKLVSTIKDLDESVRNDVIAALEGNGMAHTGAITYDRNPNGLTSTSGSPELNDSHDNKTLIYWKGRPAYVSGRTTKGDGWFDGDKRYSYTITYLDGEGGTDTFEKDQKDGVIDKGNDKGQVSSSSPSRVNSRGI